MWALAIWKIWGWRNAIIHDETFRNPFKPTDAIRQLLFEYEESRNMLSLGSCCSGKTEVHVAWTPPAEGFVKINTDGALRPNSSIAGCGGIIRDSNGRWVAGFYKSLGLCFVIKSEAWRLLEGRNWLLIWGIKEFNLNVIRWLWWRLCVGRKLEILPSLESCRSFAKFFAASRFGRFRTSGVKRMPVLIISRGLVVMLVMVACDFALFFRHMV